MDPALVAVDPPQSSGPQSGLTLVELIITLAILGLVLSIAYNFYLVGLKSWNSSAAKIEECQNARIALDAIIRELQYASSFSLHQEGTEIRFTAPHDQNRTLRFRLVGRELVYDSHPTGSALYFHNKVALDINKVTFKTGDRQLIIIEIETGSPTNPYLLKGAVLPRNLSLNLADSENIPAQTVDETDEEGKDD